MLRCNRRPKKASGLLIVEYPGLRIIPTAAATLADVTVLAEAFVALLPLSA